MKVKNFFNEDIDVDTEDSEIGEQLEQKYGIPREYQSVYKGNGTVFLALKKKHRPSGGSRGPVPEEYAELGCTQEHFDFYYSRYGEDAKRHMFPFLSTIGKKRNVFFKKISKTNLDDVDAFIERLDEKEQDLIVSHAEEYIHAFLNGG